MDLYNQKETAEEKLELLIELFAHNNICIKENNLEISIKAILEINRTNRFDYFIELISEIIANIRNK